MSQSVEDTYLAFGPADPSAKDRLMAGADVIAGGMDSSTGAGWAEDMFLSGYGACQQPEGLNGADGVCPDSAFYPGGGRDSKKWILAAYGR